jgi:hypothetical protein
MDEDDAYMRHLEQVYAGAPVLSDTQPESNPEQSQYSSHGNGNENLVARTFTALPSTYQSRSSRPPGRESDHRTECVFTPQLLGMEKLLIFQSFPLFGICIGQKNGIGRNHLSSPCLRIRPMDRLLRYSNTEIQRTCTHH